MYGIAVSICVFSRCTTIMIVPSAVIWGVTCKIKAASMYWTEIVLLIVVWIGIFSPCSTWPRELFCVMIFGRDSTLPAPFDSAAVRIKSSAKLPERCAKVNPEVGPVAGKLVAKGLDVVPPTEYGRIVPVG